MPGVPPPVDLNAVPFLCPLVATFRLVCAASQHRSPRLASTPCKIVSTNGFIAVAVTSTAAPCPVMGS